MSRRSERIAEAIKREAGLLVGHELRDPRIGFVTIIKVNLTADLRSAVIYYSVLGDGKIKNLTRKGLNNALRFIRKEIGRRLDLRYAPEIRFKMDDTLDYTQHIEDVLKKIKDEKKEK